MENNTFSIAKTYIWNNHDRHITLAFCHFLQQNSLTDVSIVCADKTIPAHKLVLASASPFFHRVISENPCKHPIIILHDYPSSIIEMILGFIYTGEVNIPHETTFAFMEAAKDLEIMGLEFLKDMNNSPQISPSLQQPRRKQPKPNRLLEQEVVVPNAPLDFSLKSTVSSTIDDANVNEECLKKQKMDTGDAITMNQNVESVLKPVEMNKNTMIPKTTRDEMEKSNKIDLLSLPYPTLKPFNARIHLDGLSPEYKPIKKKQKRSQSLSAPNTPTSQDHKAYKDLSILNNIQRQHQSARGGPPRSWTNQDLLNALDDVWSKRMNTSQAARYHRIPYNSLLMYVRGKYGKTLNIKINEEHHQQNQTATIPQSSQSPPPLTTQLNAAIPVNFLSDENNLRHLFQQSFPQQGCLPPHDLLHNFAVLSKAAAQHNIK